MAGFVHIFSKIGLKVYKLSILFLGLLLLRNLHITGNILHFYIKKIIIYKCVYPWGPAHSDSSPHRDKKKHIYTHTHSLSVRVMRNRVSLRGNR